MKLNVNTLTVLKNFATINNSMQITQGNVISVVTPLKNMFAQAKLDQEFERTFAIYDVSKFLSVLSLYKEPELILREYDAEIRADNRKIRYKYCEPSFIATLPKQINYPKWNCQFAVTPEHLASLQKAVSVLGVPEVAFCGQDGKLSIEALDSSNPDSDFYSDDIGQTNETFRAIFSIEYFKFLPRSYNVSVSKAGMAMLKNDELEYLIPTQAKKSKF